MDRKSKEILQQSQSAFKQWGEQWKTNATRHGQDPQVKSSIGDFENIGIGRAILAIGNGYSLEENIETIKEYQHNVDIMCCDKTLGHLLDNGIVPTYCVVADANVDAKYIDKWKDKLHSTILFMNVCGNPAWSDATWKKKYYFVNRDILKSEQIFSGLSGCTNIILAATNVSNAMIVLLTQCTDNQPRNFFGYDKILLIGFDYCWKHGGKYYAFDDSGDSRAQYMKHMYISTPAGNMGYTSGNLYFSFKWIMDYINGFKVPVVQCAADALLQTGKSRNLAEQMQYNFKPHHATRVQGIVKKLRSIMEEKQKLDQLLNSIGKEHQTAFQQSI